MERIKNFLNKSNYDIRLTRNARFMDQKVTPDVLSIIADCVLEFIKDNTKIQFTTKDIWESQYAKDNVSVIFNKPNVTNQSAKSEYDKFFAQPLKMLAYSGILKETKNQGKNIYQVKEKDLLGYIALKERNALEFLSEYLEKVLRDSMLWEYFDIFFTNPNTTTFNSLKDNFRDFLYINTEITDANKYEPGRIFAKILNPLSYKFRTFGSKGGFISEDVIGYSELMYNRRNWRDIKKRGTETRTEYEKRVSEAKEQEKALYKFNINKAKRLIKERYNLISEIDDYLARGDATQVHHIFPEAEFPQIKAYLENLILLTASQHSTFAHPENNTKRINKDYQLTCLLSKTDSIEESINLSDGFYSKEDFILVLNEGLCPMNTFSEELSFNEIKNKLIVEFKK